MTVSGGNVVLGGGGFGGGSFGGGSLDIGVSGGGGASAVGALNITGGSLRLGGSIDVGNVSGNDATSSAQGALSVSGDELAAGAVRVGQGTGAGTADGRLSLTGVTGSVQLLQVGEAFGAGSNPHGRVDLSGTTLDVERFVALGSGLGGGAGDAGLSLVDSRLVVGTNPTTSSLDGKLFVAASGAASSATLSLERSLVDVADDLVFGEGALLDITIGGGARETEYGAIDAGQAFLDGALQVQFDVAPVAASMVFDLIVTDLLDGITGVFDSVSILGLDPAYTATHGVVVDTVGASEVEIYRLRIARAGVPEPGTLGMVLAVMALASGAAARREARSAGTRR